MPSSKRSRLLAAIRLVLAAVGFGVAGVVVTKLATLPSPPPGSDGFAYGMAGLFGGIVVVAGLALATASIALPSLLGFDDSLGFGDRQRRVLRGAGSLLVGGLLGVTLGLVAISSHGILPFLYSLLFAFLASGVAGLVVLATIISRAVQVYEHRSQSDGTDTS